MKTVALINSQKTKLAINNNYFTLFLADCDIEAREKEQFSIIKFSMVGKGNASRFLNHTFLNEVSVRSM